MDWRFVTRARSGRGAWGIRHCEPLGAAVLAGVLSALLWCQHFPGASTFLMPENFWCRHFPGAWLILAINELFPPAPHCATYHYAYA